MKVDEVLLEVVEQCVRIDAKAGVIYHNFAGNSKDEKISAMWARMAGEEEGHVEAWKRFLVFIREASASYIFDNPMAVRKQLNSIMEKVDCYVEESRNLGDSPEAFVIACNLELYMLNRSFVSLFYYLQSISEEDYNFGEEYGAHLGRFINAINEYDASPEMKVLGSAIERLWVDNTDLVIQSNRDFLTNVLNRRGFFQTITPLAYMAQRDGNNVAIIMLDGDNFKKVNDEHGHQAGDDILKLMGDTMRENVRRSDVVARYGGEEFIVFLSNVKPENLLGVAEKIRKAVEEKSKALVPVTVSLGVAQKILDRDADKEVERLIGKADEYLYMAKKTGKNKVVGEHNAQD